jgi:hypothetical protein
MGFWSELFGSDDDDEESAWSESSNPPASKQLGHLRQRA